MYVCTFATHTQCGLTALMKAARHGHSETLRLLLAAGADKDAKTSVCDIARNFSRVFGDQLYCFSTRHCITYSVYVFLQYVYIITW